MAEDLLSLAAPPPDMLQNASLFLDFDGTLVELADRPDAIIVDDAVTGLLDRLAARLPGRVAIVSGRSIAQLEAFLGDAVRGLSLAGSHGLERRSAGGRHVPERPPGLDRAAMALRDFAASHPGTIVEEKSFGVALHYRLAPELEARARAVVQDLAGRHGLSLQPGKMMAELKVSGGDKGAAIDAFMDEPEMSDTIPVFLGDDATDEPGFAAAATHRGAGILIGAARPTAARYRLPDVAAARAWLDAAVRA